MSPRSIIDLISLSNCCQKKCLKCLDYKYTLEKMNAYLSMNKNMQNAYLVGCKISTLACYDYHVAYMLFCRIEFKRIHSIGKLCLSKFKHDKKKILNFIQKHITNEIMAHWQTLQCLGCVTYFPSLESACQIEAWCIFQRISQGEKSNLIQRIC